MRLRAGDWLVLALVVAGTGVLLALGTWQVQRLAWKQGLIARVEANRSGEPVPYDELVAIAQGGGDVEYRPVRLRGRFLHEHEQYYLATHEGTTGRFVYTPLERSDGRFVWVNRGFVPQRRMDPATRADGQVAGTVEVTGLAREAPDAKPNFFTPENEPARRLYFWKDRDTMTRAAGLSPERVQPLFVDAARTGEHAVAALPRGGITRIEFSNNHLQYSVTWYGLAGCLVLVGGLFLVRRVRARG